MLHQHVQLATNGSGTIVAASIEDNSTKYSTDNGATWQFGQYFNNIRGVAYAFNNFYVLVTSDNDNDTFLYKSSDGISWTAVSDSNLPSWRPLGFIHSSSVGLLVLSEDSNVGYLIKSSSDTDFAVIGTYIPD